MANFSGNQYQVGIGIRDQSSQAIGSGTSSVDEVTEMKLTTVNDIAWAGAFQTSTIQRSGRRAYLNQDYISTYGPGTWTWDFDYLADDQLVCQKLLSLIYPTGAGNTAATAITVPTAPVNSNVGHGATGTTDSCADITILAPTYTGATVIGDEDRTMQNCILQNLTIACDSGTDGARPHLTGQFMSGYKPTISDSGTSITAGTAGNEWDYSLFDMTTRTICGVATATVKSFSVTIDNPATRVGWQGTGAEADGYIRSGLINITGNATIKLTSGIADLLDTWIGEGAIGSPIDKATTAITLENGSSWSISLPSVLITGWSQDQANDGIFVNISFMATGGSTGSTANLAVIKMT